MKKLALGALCLAGFLAACGGGDSNVTPVDGPAGDLDQGTAVWDEAESSAHTGV